MSEFSYQDDEIIVESVVAGPFMTNLYVVGCAKTRVGAIIDAGGEPDALLELAARHELDIEKILQTHAHIDHVGGLEAVVEATDAPIYLHPEERELYDAAPQQAVFFGLTIDPLPPVDAELVEGDVVELGELRAEVAHLPGHSPGSIVFHFAEQQMLFSGDVLFRGSIGRTDLPGCDPQAMQRSLERIAEYPGPTRVLSGHGPATTIERERRSNPFLRR
jgi:glyoxylase-like metal-dependent hydrolase (beta-lactamase superfamily II)